MDNEYIFRPAKKSEIDQLRELGLVSYGQFRNTISKENWEQWEVIFTNNEIIAPLLDAGKCFVCEYERNIIGMAFLIPHGNPYKWFEAGWSYIRLVGVHPNFEGNGIGRKLTQLCIDHAKESGEKIIALHTSEFQNAARHIYESIGFEKKKEFELYGKKYWVYTLELEAGGRDEITLHKVRQRDIPTLVELRILFAIELAGGQTKDILDTLRKQLTDYFSRSTADNSCISIIAKSNNKVVGIGSVHLRDMPGNLKNPSGKWGYIMNMYTLPAFRRKGICKGILNALVEEGIKSGITAFELHATEAGELVYKQNGFEIHNEPTYRKFVY